MNVTERKAPQGLPEGLTTRAAMQFLPSTLREEDRSVEFILSTETPAKVWSWERFDVIDEVLVAKGVILPQNRQIPLQDSHDRSSTKSTLGSVREIRVENDRVIGRLYFARSADAVEAFEKVRDGHIDSGSVGYSPTEFMWLEENQRAEYNGKTYDGPMQLTTGWNLKEYSLVAIGADPNAKARAEIEATGTNSRSADDNSKENLKMDENKTIENAAIEAERKAKEAADKERAADEKLKLAERKLVDANIRELCARYDVKDLAAKLIEDGADMVRAQELVLEKVAERQQPISNAERPAMSMGETDEEKFRAAVVDGLMVKAFQGSHGISNLAPGNEQFRNRSLLQIGEELLQRAGVNTRNYSKTEIAGMLLGKRLGQRGAISTDNTTASFANITENVLSKSAMKGFSSQAHVWNQICSIGSTSDFKSTSRVGLSENADLPLKQEGAEYRQSKFSDKKESGSIGTYADATTLTEEALINDDLGVLTTIPMRKGAAAMRVPETLLFSAINTPPTLNATSLSWFNANNGSTAAGNKMTDADGLTSTNLAAAIARMRSFTGFTDSTETNTDYLEIQPKTLLVHQNNAFTAKILLNSAGLPEASMNSGVINPFADEGMVSRASSRISTSTSFYLFADPNLYPVAEMLFLDGRVAPESFLDPSTNIDGLTYRIRIRCGLIILEWRTALEFTVA